MEVAAAGAGTTGTAGAVPAGARWGATASRRALRVLVLSPLIPHPPHGGFAIRVLHLALELLRRGHAVTILAHGTEGDGARALRWMGMDIRVVEHPGPSQPFVARARALVSSHSQQWHVRFSPSMQAAITRLLDEDRHDVIQLESGEFWSYDYRTTRPIVLDAHNIWSELYERSLAIGGPGPRRLYRTVNVAKARAEEIQAWATVDACLATSDRERRIMEAAGARRVAVVPNGVDTEAFQPLADVIPVEGRLVFTGVVRYGPNEDAVRRLVREILPRVRRQRPDASLDIVGRGLTPRVRRLAGPGVRLTGAVPDVRPWLARASAAVVPLRVGRGTRLKILEALAMGRPVVSTSIGAEGLDLVPGTHLLIADDPESFAGAVVRVLGDLELASALGRAARDLVVRRYDWRRAGEELERTLVEVAGVAPAT